MPLITQEQAQALVDAGTLSAVTVDTSIFDVYNCNLEHPALSALDQFRGTEVSLIFSPVTTGEVRAHIAEEIKDAITKARAGINQFLKCLNAKGDLDRILEATGLRVDPARKAEGLVSAFLEATGAELITEVVSSAELLDAYFAHRAPFAAKGDKKAEFPDAIALIALEKWAESRSSPILAVSNDNDWKKFAALSANLFCLSEKVYLQSVLRMFNRRESVAAARLKRAIKAGTVFDAQDKIFVALSEYIEDFSVDSNSSYFYQDEAFWSKIESWEVKPDTELDVVRSDEDEITIAFEVEFKATFEASFRFQTRDTDREWVTLGSRSDEQEATLTATVFATFEKNFRKVPVLLSASAAGDAVIIDFGNVEPVW